MICYHDMTFCPFWESCADGDECPRALTTLVVTAAHEWIGSLPICQYISEPECFVPILGAILPKSGTKSGTEE